MGTGATGLKSRRIGEKPDVSKSGMRAPGGASKIL
jgi:hypothetical protein